MGQLSQAAVQVPLNEIQTFECNQMGSRAAKQICEYFVRKSHFNKQLEEAKSQRSIRSPLAAADLRSESYYNSDLKNLLPKLADLDSSALSTSSTNGAKLQQAGNKVNEEMALMNGIMRFSDEASDMGRWQPMRGKRLLFPLNNLRDTLTPYEEM